MLQDMRLQRIPPRPFVGMRRRIPTLDIGKNLVEVLPQVAQFLDRIGVEPAGPPFTRYHGYRKGTFDVDAGFPIAQPLPGEGEIIADSLPGGRAATAWHIGPYYDLGDSWIAFLRWIKGRYRPLSWGWEFYWSWNVDGEDTSGDRTELVIPVW